MLPASLAPYQFEISPDPLPSAQTFVIGGYDQIKVVSTALDEALWVPRSIRFSDQWLLRLR
jgi:hypothetical protein